jgi:hypothetical protein
MYTFFVFLDGFNALYSRRQAMFGGHHKWSRKNTGKLLKEPVTYKKLPTGFKAYTHWPIPRFDPT